MEALMDWRNEAGSYGIEFAPSEEEDDTRRVIVLNVIHNAVKEDDPKSGGEMAEAVQSLAKSWKVKLPKDWTRRMAALSVAVETEE
jgi:hypothetical protein